MELHYHLGHLGDHCNSNQKRGEIGFHLDAIMGKFENGELNIDKSEVKLFKKIIREMRKYDGYWDKENLKYEIPFYALKGLLNKNV